MKQRSHLLIGLLVLAFSVYWLKQKANQLDRNQPVSQISPPPLHTQSHARGSTQPVPPQSRTIPLHLQNIQKMTQILKIAAIQPSLPKTVDLLQQLKLEPSLYQESHRETGTLTVVRTEKPLRGTRYFHAQYFSGDKQKPLLQHMSFEIPPGKNSLRTAAEVIKDTFGPLPQAHRQSPNMIAWKWKGKYTVWALKLDDESLANNAFNAYSSQDVGTVRIALELDIHDHHAAH